MTKLTAYVVVSIIFVALFSDSSTISAITITDSGKSHYSIVLSSTASPSEIHGAAELQMFLQMISDTYIPVLKENQTITGPMILVGNSGKLQSIIQDINLSELGDDGFVIKTVGEHLILAGGKLRGSMYAVYSFLEDVLGCRWYTSKVSKIPHLTSIKIGTLDIKEMPAFEYREPFWKDAWDGDWAARNKCNSSAAALDQKTGWKGELPGCTYNLSAYFT